MGGFPPIQYPLINLILRATHPWWIGVPFNPMTRGKLRWTLHIYTRASRPYCHLEQTNSHLPYLAGSIIHSTTLMPQLGYKLTLLSSAVYMCFENTYKQNYKIVIYNYVLCWFYSMTKSVVIALILFLIFCRILLYWV